MCFGRKITLPFGRKNRAAANGAATPVSPSIPEGPLGVGRDVGRIPYLSLALTNSY